MAQSGHSMRGWVRYLDEPAASIAEYEAAFKPVESATQADWCGVFLDLFSPDDKNPESRRFVDLEGGNLQVSADTGTEKWGRRFDPSTTVNPVLVATAMPHERKTSFRSKVPKVSEWRAAALLFANPRGQGPNLTASCAACRGLRYSYFSEH